MQNKASINADKYIATLAISDWTKVILRNGTKGVLEVEAHVKRVYLWDEKENICKSKMLLVSKKKTVKVNGSINMPFRMQKTLSSKYKNLPTCNASDFGLNMVSEKPNKKLE